MIQKMHNGSYQLSLTLILFLAEPDGTVVVSGGGQGEEARSRSTQGY